MPSSTEPPEETSAPPASSARFEPGFDDWADAQLVEDATVIVRRSRGATGERSTVALAELTRPRSVLEVKFADGSSYFTAPADFVRRYVPPPVRKRGGPAAERSRVELPSELPGRSPQGTRGGGSASAIDGYTVSQLVEPTTLDRLFDVAETFRHTAQRWFGVDAKDPKAVPIAAKLCAAFENSVLHDEIGRTNQGGVLLSWSEGAWTPVSAPLTDSTADTRPLLLLLHGTASSTQGSFGKLHERKEGAAWPTDWAALVESHRVLAWEHRSLTLSPIDNVIAMTEALLAALPGTADKPRRVDVVSHSRGGLVGELWALRTADDDARRGARECFAAHYRSTARAGEGASRDESAAAKPAGHPDAERIGALFDALQRASKRLTAGCFVRVACPARGTLLADGRTDLFLSLMLRALSMGAAAAFGPAGAAVAERFGKLVRSLVAERADAKTLPGLEAMMPGSPLTLALADCSARPTDRLRVVAGDAAARGLAGLFTLVADVFYGWHDHDYVVHTRSMFGGLKRAQPARSLRWENPSVSHFAYFGAGTPSRSALMSALEGRDDDAVFRPIDDDERATRSAQQRGLLQLMKAGELNRPDFAGWLRRCNEPAQAGKPVLVVLAGIMGSELKHASGANDDLVWLSLGSMLRGDVESLELRDPDDRRLEASGLLAVSYWQLLERAGRRFNVIALPYDWRRPIAESGALLATRLAQIVAAVQDKGLPVHVIAHSMGGLVARHALYIDDAGRALWRELKTARKSRLLQLGTPNRGSYSPAQLLLGQHGMSKVLGLVARKVSMRDLSRFGAGFYGLMQMLPQEPDANFGDLFDAASWAQVQTRDSATVLPATPVLDASRAYVRGADFKRSFDELFADPSALYVAGTGLTVVRMEAADNPWDASLSEAGMTPAEPIKFMSLLAGDGTVPWTSTLAPERTWYAPCEHGTLADHTDSFEAYFELLLTGSTRRLSQERPGEIKRGAGSAAPVAVPHPRAGVPALLPTSDEELALLILQPELEAGPNVSKLAEPIQVRVVHGGLDYARHPLMVGHYQNDRASGAAKRVDEKLDGQLDRLLQLKLFEGAERTSYYLRPNNHTAGKPPYPGAVLLGLGAIGDLTPAGLAETVTRGVLRYAFEHVHRDPFSPAQGPVPLSLSSVLIGTQIQAVTTRDSLAGVLYGMWTAAQLLAQMDIDGGGAVGPVRIRELELIEIDETTALDTAYELARLMSRPEWKERLVWPAGVIEQREGALFGYRQRSSNGTWQRLVIEQEEHGGLSFALIGDRARVESTQVAADVKSLAGFLDRIADDRAEPGDAVKRAIDPRLGSVLYQLLLPNDLKSRLANLDNTVLVVDDETARYPWELLCPPLATRADGDTPRPFVVHAGMVRQRKTLDFRRLPQPVVGYDALVVGAPSTAGWFDEAGEPIAFSDLKGARDEAHAVHRLLKDDAVRPWKPTALISEAPPEGGVALEPGSQTVLFTLLERPWRLVHLSGHGVVDQWIRAGDGPDARPTRKTGLVLRGQELLGAAEVEQMSPAPEFVFINACYSGHDGTSAPATGKPESLRAQQRVRHQATLAASLAQRFIAMGSKAVLATGWQVDDAAALDFARVFYGALLGNGETGDRGLSFGEAVKAARAAVFEHHGHRCNTWGAYQAYGDPQWRLEAGQPEAHAQGGSSRLRGAELCMSAGELAARIAQVQAVAGDKPPAELLEQLANLEAKLRGDERRRDWLRESCVRAALGTAYRELGDHRRAAECFQKAARSARSHVRIGDLDALIDSLAREGSKEGRVAALKLIDRLDAVRNDAEGRWPLELDDPKPQRVGTRRRLRAAEAEAADADRPEPSSASERIGLKAETALRERSESIKTLPASADVAGEDWQHTFRGLYGIASTFHDSFTLKRLEEDKPARCAHSLASALLVAGLARLMDPAPAPIDRRAKETAQWWLDEADRLIDALVSADDLSDFAGGATRIELLGARYLYARTMGLPYPEDLVARCDQGIREVMVRWPSPIELEGLRHRFELVRSIALRLPPTKVTKDLLDLATTALEQLLQPRYVRRAR